ncbi:TPA: relaxase/mobilization nuclease domain-containing protein [Vibrio cholerae]|uniref:relaxase/mobilization nuclease domain-containing protein n=1 Tax=Vibrio campbellii TaxID=680 RepID=UPI001B83A901|nr:relaxase/mobilization nuclease domain-containing protein [Vibrio campbellii]EGQ9469059.1 relaxase/mobilization nuclease domain-containing protein [Vibrio parahaemolyticus]EKA6049014.1 relaxase/mobilization nuclease domain-containing protein [Vibrio vulnificus]HBC3376489.1 relaxase/mobilization nuclease domain-containing protein [Vibrio cholerae]EIY9800914.1 relaxase/mobilization nuclease domain-containing protein [Vibrio parahaemolyticus]EJB0387340.1 relaxase/mobilization nuclease domain-co
MIYKEPEQNGGKHTEQTADVLIKYVAGDDERLAKYLVNYGAGATKSSVSVTEFVYANNIIHIPENAKCASGEMLDMSLVIREMQESIRLNPSAKQQFKHMIVSVDTNESLTNPQWCKTAKNLMSRLGYANCRYIVFKHNDTDQEHIHVITSTIDIVTRKRIKDSYSKIRAQEVMRELEIEFGLRQLVSSSEIGYDTDADINDAKKFNKKAQIARLVKTGINKLKPGSNLAEFVTAVESTHSSLKVELQTKKGIAVGIVFNLDGVRMSASQLGGNRKYTLGKLIGNGILHDACKDLSNYEEELERAAAHAQEQSDNALRVYESKQDQDMKTYLVMLSVNVRYRKEVEQFIDDMKWNLRARKRLKGASYVVYVVEMISMLKDVEMGFETVIEALFLDTLDKAFSCITKRKTMENVFENLSTKQISESDYKTFIATAHVDILHKNDKPQRSSVNKLLESIISQDHKGINK